MAESVSPDRAEGYKLSVPDDDIEEASPDDLLSDFTDYDYALSIGLPPILRLPFRMQCLVFLGSGRGLRLRTPRLGRRKPFFDQRLGLAPGGLVDAPGADLLDEEFGESPYQRVGAVWRRASAAHAEARRVGRVPLRLRAVEIRGELAHLVFKRREGAHVPDAALLVERRHRFGPHHLAAGGVHCGIGDVVVDHAQRRLDHLALLTSATILSAP